MMIAAAAFALASLTFRPNSTLPQTTMYNRCGGANISPELHWSNAPRGTRSFALTLFDPDATGGWYHWVAYNIPATTTRFSSGVRLPIGELGATSFKQLGYGGPCPPPGKVHHYIFTLGGAGGTYRLVSRAQRNQKVETRMWLCSHHSGHAGMTGPGFSVRFPSGARGPRGVHDDTRCAARQLHDRFVQAGSKFPTSDA